VRREADPPQQWEHPLWPRKSQTYARPVWAQERRRQCPVVGQARRLPPVEAQEEWAVRAGSIKADPLALAARKPKSRALSDQRSARAARFMAAVATPKPVTKA